MIIQFLKGRSEENEISRRLEPEIKVFSFEKLDRPYAELSKEEQSEEAANMRNGVNFAKKVLSTRDCDVLILDEILGIVDQGIISKEEFQSFLESRDEETELVMTGRVCPEGIEEYVTDISRMENIDVDNHQE